MEDSDTISLREYMQVQIDALSAALRDFQAVMESRSTEQKQAVDVAFMAAKEAVQTALAAAKEAVAKAEVAYEARFALMNEFRQQLNDQAATFMPRTEAEAADRRTNDQLQELKDRMNTSDGRSGGISASRAALLVIIPVIVSILGLILVFATR